MGIVDKVIPERSYFTKVKLLKQLRQEIVDELAELNNYQQKTLEARYQRFRKY